MDTPAASTAMAETPIFGMRFMPRPTASSAHAVAICKPTATGDASILPAPDDVGMDKPIAAPAITTKICAKATHGNMIRALA